MSAPAARAAAAVASSVVRAAQSFAGTTRMASEASLRASSAADSVILVSSTQNNVHVTVSDLEGRVVTRATGGMMGHKHRARASPQAASEVAQRAGKAAVDKGFAVAHLHLKGPSRSRGLVLRGLLNAGVKITTIRDVTPVPTPGTRPPAARRL